jgi:hypothetical protein
VPVPAATETAAASNAGTPEAAFAEIVAEFRRGVEKTPIRLNVHDNDGSKTMMTGKNVVTHEVLPTKNEGDPLKAVIRVSSESRYSVQRSTESRKTNSSNDATEQSASTDSNVQVFDSSIASTTSQSATSNPSAETADPKAVVVGMADEKDERAYELVYENGRWKLITELDPDTEGLIKLAFERALATQG